MAKASISIAISGSYNGAAFSRAEAALDRIAIKTAAYNSSVGSQLINAGSRWADVGGQIYNVGDKVARVGDKLTKNVTIPMGIAAIASGKAAIDIDTALTGVKKTVDGTEEQYQKLKESAIEFSKTNGGVTAAQILDIQALGGQLGFTVEELDKLAKVAAGLDLSTNMDAETATTEMAQFANITKMAHDDVDRYGSAIVALGNTSATTEADISHMALRIAGAGKQVGLTQPEILGLSAALSSMGIEAEAGGSAISTIMSKIDKEVATNGETLETWAETAGMSVDDFVEAWKTRPAEALQAVFSNMEKVRAEGGNLSVVLSDLGIDAIRQTDLMKRMAGNSEVLAKSINTANTAWQENSALTTEVSRRNESMQARFEMLQNKIIAVGASVGGPLVEATLAAIDAAEPLIKSVADAATAFANMDTSQQQTVMTMGLMVAAAGPVLKVVGNISKTAGNLVTAFGKAEQKIGTYADALSTTNAKSLDTYKRSKELNKVIEKNPAVAAAGGYDKYREAITKAAQASGDYKNALSKLKTETGKGAQANQELVDKLKAEVVQKREVRNKTADLVASYNNAATAAKANAGAVKAQATAMQLASTAGTVLKGVLATVIPTLIVSGIVAAIGAISSEMERAKKHSENFTKATKGLEEASKLTTDELKQARDQFPAYGEAASGAKVNIEELLEKQAALADRLQEVNTHATAQSGTLMSAYQTIETYANKTGLTATEQDKLRAAVQIVNDLCGTQISVTDGVNGKLADQGEAIDDVRGKIGKYIDETLRKIQIEAQSEKLKELYKQQTEDTAKLVTAKKELADAQQRATDAEKEYFDALQNNQDIDGSAKVRYDAAKKNLDEVAGKVRDAQGALDSVNTAIENVNTSIAATSSVAEGASNKLGSVAGSSKTLLDALSETNIPIDNFIRDLSDAGMSVEDFKQLNADQLTQLVAEYQNSSDSIVNSIKNHQWSMHDAGTLLTQALRNGMDDGRISVEQGTAMLQRVASGDWQSVIAEAEQHGIKIPEAIAKSMEMNQFVAENSTEIMQGKILDVLNKKDAPDAAAKLGSSITGSLSDALDAGSNVVAPSTNNLVNGVINDVNTGFQMQDGYSRLSHDLGAKFTESLAKGIGTRDAKARAAAEVVARSVVDGISPFSKNLNDEGENLTYQFARGITERYHEVKSAANTIKEVASSMGDANSAQWGAHLAQNFARGIRGGAAGVASAALSVLNEAKKYMQFTEPEKGPWSGAEHGGITSGRHLAENFARGMVEGSPLVARAANKLALSASFSAAPRLFSSSQTPTTFGTNVVHNHYSIGDVTLDASSLKDVLTIEGLFRRLKQAKEVG